MFISTFYSFKGGVGRTMALANIAAHLADSGQKVLVVDFDLEAPGLKSLFPSARRSPGILEFIQEYERTQIVPDVRNYCYQTKIGDGEGQLWVMPASVDVRSHAESLAKIEWQDLYRNRNGYLLIEDLKQQWEKYLEVDYVFVDSRTGHTDVEGICTRQLPDALVSMFYPNDQNLSGIKEVSERIKEYLRNNENRSVKQIYVASNVPDLDDEHNVLSRMLDRFRDTIEYQQLDSVIHHYPSLLLLEDPLFVRSRPKTQLAKEYRVLTEKIRMLNASDEVGVKSVLKQELSGRYVPGRISRSRRLIIDDIYRFHSDNPEILHLLSIWKERRGESEEASQLLDRSIQLGFLAPDVLLRHARHKAQSGDNQTATSDIRRALASDEIKFSDLVKTVQLNHKFHLGVLPEVSRSNAVLGLDVYDFCHFIDELSTSKLNLQIAHDAIGQYERGEFEDEYGILPATKSIVLIGLGQFDEAMECIKDSGRPTKDDGASRTFNYAMAEWGSSGQPPVDLFQWVVDSASEPGSVNVNYNECLAISNWAIGDSELALEYINQAIAMQKDNFSSELSSWSYQVRGGEAMRTELLAVRSMVQGSEVIPLFMQKTDLFETSALQ